MGRGGRYGSTSRSISIRGTRERSLGSRGHRGLFQRHGGQGDAEESFNTDGERGRTVAGGEYHPEDDAQDERDLVLLGRGESRGRRGRGAEYAESEEENIRSRSRAGERGRDEEMINEDEENDLEGRNNRTHPCMVFKLKYWFLTWIFSIQSTRLPQDIQDHHGGGNS